MRNQKNKKALSLANLARKIEVGDIDDERINAEIFKLEERVHAYCMKTTKCQDCSAGCRGLKPRKVEATRNGNERIFWVTFHDGCNGGTEYVSYTTSVDAALTLRDEDYRVESLTEVTEDGETYWICKIANKNSSGAFPARKAKTAARVITAALLHAKSEMLKKG